MKRLVLLMMLTVGIIGAWNVWGGGAANEENKQTAANETRREQVDEIAQTALFVPYWTLQNEESNIKNHNTLIYFGIAANSDGIEDEVGRNNIKAFLDKAGGNQKKLLTIRMIDHDINLEILENKEAQEKIIAESIEIAKSNGFDGLVIDFETKSIGFEDVTEKTTDFLIYSIDTIQKNDLEAHTLLFGDTYYRVRAFDVEKIGEASDSVMIMTYDFHKARGNPGPNFPLNKKEDYGYDLQQMLDDYTSDVAADKMVIILGMFGYDWELDESGSGVGLAQPISLNNAKEKYINACPVENCNVTADIQSGETVVTYTDEGGSKHEIWVENEESAQKKIEYIKKQGIDKIGYWAHSFF